MVDWAMIRGTIVYFSAYDIAYDVRREGLHSVLGTPLVPFTLDATHRIPASMLTEGVYTAQLPPFRVNTPHGPETTSVQVKIFSMGALSLTLRLPFEVPTLSGLVGYHEPTVGNRTLVEHARDVATTLFHDLAPALIKPVKELQPDDAYTLFYIESNSLGEPDTRDWFDRERVAIAGLLTQEPEPHLLAREEVEENTSRSISYYKDDLVVVDWDAALAVDVPGHLEEVIYPLELANVQLAELESFDRILESAVRRAYGDTSRRKTSIPLSDLETLRIDMARTAELLENTGKLYGDWHLARLHRLAAERFHLQDWVSSSEKKRETLDAIHQAIKGDRNQFVMVVLELMVVILFVIDIIWIVTPHK